MNRRKFFRNGALFTVGSTLINPFSSVAQPLDIPVKKGKKAKRVAKDKKKEDKSK